MIRSMTGFARRERQFPWGLLAWELKTVNHRFLEIGMRLPEEFRVGEAEFRQGVAASVRRGKVECSLHFRPAVVAGALEVDTELLASLMQRAQTIAAQAGAAARIDALELLRWPGVIRDGTRDFAPMIAAARAKLLERIAQLVSDVDHERLEQELAILAQRLDVDEEIDRLRGHVTEVRKTFGGQEPAGRRLDFLMQELNREANTLSSKSQDIETTRAAVDMKVLIEQMREQVQNVE